MPSLDGKHQQVRDEFCSRGAIELPTTDETAKGAEHLGVEIEGTWKAASSPDSKSAAGLPGAVSAVTATEASST